MTTSRAGYWVGGGLMVAAAVGTVLWVLLSLSQLTHTIDGFQRVDAGAGGAVTLKAHKYVIYVEGPGANDELLSSDVGATVTDAQTGAEVPTHVYLTSLTYTFGGHSGNAIETVTPAHAGRYEIRYDGSGGNEFGISPADIRQIAVGESVGSRLTRTLAGAFLIAALLGLGGIAILVTTIVRRSTARRRASQPPQFAAAQAVAKPPGAWAPQAGSPPPGHAPPEPEPEPPPPAPDSWRGY